MAPHAPPAAAQFSTRATLAEITERVENALSSYERMEELDPRRFAGVRRQSEEDATYGDLANSGRARIETYIAALNDISLDRKAALGELRSKLEYERQRAEQAEKEGRRGGVSHDGDDDVSDEATLLERLDMLEHLQHRLPFWGVNFTRPDP